MAVAVIHKRLPSVRPAVPSLLGDGLPERLRSTSIALLGAIAAAGLALAAFAFQLGFPLVASGPLPERPPKLEAVAGGGSGQEGKPGEGIPPSAAPATVRAAGPGSPPSPVAGAVPAAAAETQPSESPPSVSDPAKVGEAPKREPPAREAAKRRRPEPPAVQQPTSTTVSTPTAAAPVEPSATSSEAPEPAPETIPEEPAASHPGNGHAYGKGNGNGLGNGGNPPGQAAKGTGPSE